MWQAVREREREVYYNSDRMYAQTSSDDTTVHTIKFTAYKIMI